MRAPEITHRVAIASLAIVGIESAVGASHAFGVPPISHLITPFIDLALWGFLTWKVWKRPRKWGLGVGIFVLLLIPFQTWLFHLAMPNPAFRAQGYTWTSFLLFDELPLLVAGMSCITLRFVGPRPPQA